MKICVYDVPCKKSCEANVDLVLLGSHQPSHHFVNGAFHSACPTSLELVGIEKNFRRGVLKTSDLEWAEETCTDRINNLVSGLFAVHTDI